MEEHHDHKAASSKRRGQGSSSGCARAHQGNERGKTINVNIEDLDGCIKAKGLKRDHAALLKGFSNLLQDIHSSNADATTVTLTPKNVEKVLGAEPLEPEKEEESAA